LPGILVYFRGLLCETGNVSWSDRKLKQIREIHKSLERNPFSEIYVCVNISIGKMSFPRIYPGIKHTGI
jgi:hypothetical protein